MRKMLLVIVVSLCNIAACQKPSSLPENNTEKETTRSPAPAPSGVVVVRSHTSDRNPVQVNCLTGEQLTGGGCRAPLNLVYSHPVDVHENDTEAAGWVCDTDRSFWNAELTAFALCQGLARSDVAQQRAAHPSEQGRAVDAGTPTSTP